MTICIYHRGHLLFKTKNETKAWEKAKLYSKWFSSVEIRSEKNKPDTYGY